jgi:hypothetical protein
MSDNLCSKCPHVRRVSGTDSADITSFFMFLFIPCILSYLYALVLYFLLSLISLSQKVNAVTVRVRRCKNSVDIAGFSLFFRRSRHWPGDDEIRGDVRVVPPASGLFIWTLMFKRTFRKTRKLSAFQQEVVFIQKESLDLRLGSLFSFHCALAL